MATRKLDLERPIRDSGPGWIRFVWWPLSIVLTFYMVAFSLICIDEFFAENRILLKPMQRYTPDLVDPFCEACQLVYRPQIALMGALKIIDP